VVLPLGLRKGLSEEKLQEGFVLVAGTRNKFLELHPMSEWIRREALLEESFGPGDEVAEEFLIDLHASVVNVDLDKQYRFLIGDPSKELAGIKRDVLFIGMGKKIIIFSKERWAARQEERKEKMAPPEGLGRS
jgi:MraZ protein